MKKRSTDITQTKDIYLPGGKTRTFDCDMMKKPSYFADGLVTVNMKSQRKDHLSLTLKVELMNGKIHMNITNTGQGQLHINQGQSTGVVDLTLSGYFLSTRANTQICLHERLTFLIEEESHDYFLKCTQVIAKYFK